MNVRHRNRSAAICLTLLALAAAVYLQVASHEFLLYDDPNYVTDNPHVRSGLTLTGIAWAFSSFHDNNWFPLTWISHMLDVQLFGLAAGMHHLVNVAFHAANGMLLFLLLNRLTGCIWRSAVVAALFALHPLHVESVAWVAERKDLLSSLFLLLTLHAYLRYTEQPGTGRYILTVFLYALGLMAKPMLVTLPLIMVLLDYWPLNRLSQQQMYRHSSRLISLITEKIPFALLALASCAVTVMAQKSGISSLEAVPLLHRIANAAVAYVTYIGRAILPLDLSPFYPLPLTVIPWKPVAASLLLTAVSIAVWIWRKKYPYLIVGWLWYIIMLLPVIGLVQIGMQSTADRYTYLPLTGLFILVVWLVSDCASESALKMKVAAWGSIGAITVYAGVAWKQVSYWQDNETLFTRAYGINRDNFIASQILGIVSVQKGDYEKALKFFDNAINSAPWFAPSYLSAGNALIDIDRTEEAVEYFETALRIRPTAAAYYNLGGALHRLGNLEDAIRNYRSALTVNPGNTDYLNNLGIALADLGNTAEAIRIFEEVLIIDPNYENARKNLANARSILQKPDE